jgi:TolA-binding protein
MKPYGPMRRISLPIVASLTVVVSWGCAPNAQNEQMQADQLSLRSTVANDQQQIDSLQEKIRRLDDRVSELEHNGSASTGSGKQLASIEQRLNKLESQSNSAQAGAANSPSAAPTNSAAPSESAAAPDDNEAEANENGKEASGNGEEGAASAEAATAPPSSGTAVTTSEGNAPSWRAMVDQELSTTHDDPAEKPYRAGLVELKANRYSLALSQFETLQRRYPKSSLSEPAEFFAANSLYEMGKYDQAILQFNDQTMRFPKGGYASAALLREAQAFMKINDRIDARLTLQKLLNDLPDSPEAPMAKSMMQTLSS